MIAPTLSIARTTFTEALRQPVFFIIILISGVLQILNTWATAYSMGYSKVPGEVTGDNKLLYDIGMATVFVCGIVLAAFIATAVLSREIDKKTVLTVVSKPVSRPALILGKYLGVAGAMLVAFVIMSMFLLLGLRHGVLSTAADQVDLPVVIFGLGAVFLAVFIGGVTNYLYGWSFAQVVAAVMLPGLVIAYVAVLGISKKWELQPLGTDFLPQVTLTLGALGVALLVVTAIALAASTRLGQVMTIVICAGVFVLGLLSNHFIGRHAFTAEPLAQIASATPANGLTVTGIAGERAITAAAERAGMTPEAFRESGRSVEDMLTPRELVDLIEPDDAPRREVLFIEPGSTYDLHFDVEPEEDLPPGTPIYYGPSPNGVGMVTPSFAPPPAGFVPGDASTLPGGGSAVVIVSTDKRNMSIRNMGDPAVQVWRPPLPNDYIFTEPARIHPLAFTAWSLIPNMHAFWLVDAVTQNSIIPPSHLGLIALYGLAQIIAALAVAVLLFEGRDVG